MDDTQLEQELAALVPQADESKQSEAKDSKPEDGKQPEAETETTPTDEATDAGEPASEETEPEDSEKDEDEKPKKKPSGIERLKRRLAERDAEIAALRSRAGPSADDIANEVEKLIGKRPNEADFKGDYLAYERAQTVYELDKRQAEREVRGRATQQEQMALARRREAAEAHQERVEEFRERAKDFDEVLRGADELKASPVVEDLILDSDKSAHLVYYLAKNPTRLHALNGMTEREAAREIGRIESRLSLPQPKTQTAARKPISPPKGGAAPSSPERDLDAWLKRKYGS